MKNAFIDFDMNCHIIEGLKKQGITTATPVQALTIPAFTSGKDLIVESHTGSGKTLAFVLPLFEKIDPSKREMQAIILAPTHELVMQIHTQIKLLAENSGIPITSAPIMGEVNIEKQIKVLRDKPHIIVGSAGRVLDLMSKKKITAHTIKTIVLDEADNLLDQNQAGTIKKLLHLTQRDRQLCVFSASISHKTLETATQFMTNPEVLRTAKNTVLNPNIEHFVIVSEKRDKFETLRKLLVATAPEKALIFVSQNTDVTTIIEKLNHHHFTVASISGKGSKEDRKHAIGLFKSGKVQLLISSDLSARGLDIAGITHVFHFDMPLTAHDYLHRSGRTARGIAKGTSICITAPNELGAIRIYEREFSIKFKAIEVTKGQIKVGSGKNATFLPVAAPKKAPLKNTEEAPKSKSHNKYPKGFEGNGAKSKAKNKAMQPTETTFSKKTKATKKAKSYDEINFASGTLSDAMALIAEDGFGKNYE